MMTIPSCTSVPVNMVLIFFHVYMQKNEVKDQGTEPEKEVGNEKMATEESAKNITDREAKESQAKSGEDIHKQNEVGIEKKETPAVKDQDVDKELLQVFHILSLLFFFVYLSFQ